MKQLAGGKRMENDCFPRTLKFEMYMTWPSIFVVKFFLSKRGKPPKVIFQLDVVHK
jgi:hypothetical protein